MKKLDGNTPEGKKALTAEHQEIQDLKKQLWRAKRDNEILKKGSSHLYSRRLKAMKIQELKVANSDYTITELCAVFELSSSTYYDQISEKSYTKEKEKIIESIKQIAIDTNSTYGRRRMQKQLEKSRK